MNKQNPKGDDDQQNMTPEIACAMLLKSTGIELTPDELRNPTIWGADELSEKGILLTHILQYKRESKVEEAERLLHLKTPSLSAKVKQAVKILRSIADHPGIDHDDLMAFEVSFLPVAVQRWLTPKGSNRYSMRSIVERFISLLQSVSGNYERMAVGRREKDYVKRGPASSRAHRRLIASLLTIRKKENRNSVSEDKLFKKPPVFNIDVVPPFLQEYWNEDVSAVADIIVQQKIEGNLKLGAFLTIKEVALVLYAAGLLSGLTGERGGDVDASVEFIKDIVARQWEKYYKELNKKLT
jgi:hypothetical protein